MDRHGDRNTITTDLDVGPGGCDTHLHFYDSHYPSSPDAVLFPPDATPTEYRQLAAALGLDRLVIVQPTTYGRDNSCQLGALEGFGDAARAVVVIDASISPSELAELDHAGARGVRFHMLPGGALGWESLRPVAEQIEPIGWHIQLQLNGHELVEHIDALQQLPVDLVIDHIGRFMPPAEPTEVAFQALLRLIERGRTWVKLSAPYESSADLEATLPAVDALVAAAPERLLWASNWPHPGRDDPPDASTLAELTRRWLPTPELRHRVLVETPARVYRF